MDFVLYNVALLAADAAAILWMRGGPPRGWLAPILLVTLLGMLLGVLMASGWGSLGMFVMMRAAAWGVFLHGPILLLGAAFTRGGPRIRLGVTLLVLAVEAVAVDAFLIEPRWLEVTRVTVESDRIDEPIRIAVLSDIQTDEVGSYERLALRTALAERPDLVLFPGDYVQLEDRASYEAQAAAFRRMLLEAGIEPRLGAYAVQGNVEWPGWHELIFEGTPVTAVTETTRFEAGPIVVTALSFADGFANDTVIAAEDRFHVAFAHGPDFALSPHARADLLVAGHTHGGQVQLPLLGPVITLADVPRAWADDTTPLPDGRTVVVSRGVGMERGPAPRLRFLCRPEVVIVDVVPTGSRARAAEPASD